MLKKNLLKIANNKFRKKNYSDAFELYKRWQLEFPELQSIVNYNVEQCEREISRKVNVTDNYYCDLNYIEDGVLYGWACNRLNLKERVDVEIYLDEKLVATLHANKYRKDLIEDGVGDGCYSFVIDLNKYLIFNKIFNVTARKSDGTPFQNGRTEILHKHEINNEGGESCIRIVSKLMALELWDKKREKSSLSLLNEKKCGFAYPLVSIIMPTYNRSVVLSRAIKSVLCQTYKNLELIIIDDGSTDNTEEIVAGYSDSRIKYLKNYHNKGVSESRNYGIDIALGEWIFFLDSDNWWEDDLVENMICFVHTNSIDGAYCAANMVDDSLEAQSILFEEFELESCFDDNYIDLNTFCCHRDFAKLGFDPSLTRLVDWDFILRIATQGIIQSFYYLGVNYYCGSGGNRITNTEYSEQRQLDIIRRSIRSRVSAMLHVCGNVIRVSSAKRIAIVFHLYHESNIEYYIKKFKAIEAPFALFITTSLSLESLAVQKIIKEFPFSILVRYTNYGTDIGPFLQLYSTLVNYDYVCKVHTKRDMPDLGPIWREYSFDNLVGSNELVKKIIDIFTNNPMLSVVGPRKFYLNGNAHTRLSLRKKIVHFCNMLAIDFPLDTDWGFFAGTMFWIRPSKLDRFWLLQGVHRFSADYKNDGQLVHAIERIFGILYANSSNKVALIDCWDRSETEMVLASPNEFQQTKSITHILNEIKGLLH